MAEKGSLLKKIFPLLVVVLALATLSYSLVWQDDPGFTNPLTVFSIVLAFAGFVYFTVQSFLESYRKHLEIKKFQRRKSLIDAFEGEVQERFNKEPDPEMNYHSRDVNPFGFDEFEPEGLPDEEDLFGDQDEEDLPAQRGSIYWALKVLGISTDDMENSKISMHDINKFYRLKCTLYHPDKYQYESDKQKRWANAKMSDLNEAKSILYKAIDSLSNQT